MKKIVCAVIVWMLCLAFPASVVLAANTPAPVEAKSGSNYTDTSTYRIGCGDILGIMTWKEKDFTTSVLVRTDGKITFPLLGDIQAAGRTPMDLAREITTRLKEYITVPTVTVTVNSPGSQQFYILGEVAKTGQYPLTTNLTALQAFALAGGFTEWASKKEILLMRKVDGKEKIFHINYKEILKGNDSDQNLQIQAGDTIIVP